MRLAKITYANPDFKQSEGYWNILLDSKEDVICYFELIKGKHSKDVIDLWFKAKEAEGKPMVSMGHYTSGNPTKMMAYMYITEIREGEKVSLPEYCNHMDNLLVQKFSSLLDIVAKFGCAKINAAGGYSQFDNFFKIIHEIDATPIMVSKYLRGEDDFVTKETFDICTSTLVIENEQTVSSELINFLDSKGWNDMDTFMLTDFRWKTTGYTLEDYVNMFSKAIGAGLDNIVVETTMQDNEQFEGMKKIIEGIVSKKDSTLNIFILKVGEFEDVSSDCPGIKIHNI